MACERRNSNCLRRAAFRQEGYNRGLKGNDHSRFVNEACSIHCRDRELTTSATDVSCRFSVACSLIRGLSSPERFLYCDNCEKYEAIPSRIKRESMFSSSRRPNKKRTQKRTEYKEQETSDKEDEITFSEKNWWAAFFLCLFLGTLGIHRFYAGRIVSGILMLLTLGGAGIWIIIDLILLIKEDFTDGEGNYIFR